MTAPEITSIDEKHGGLVRTILETKRDFKNMKNTEPTKTAGLKDKSHAAKEIEQVRTLIQSLCKSVMPLGRSLDYIQEDLDAMNREFGSWRSEANRYKQWLNEETRQTQEILQPLEAQLKLVESSIEEQLNKISAAKALVVQNDETIKNLVRHVVRANP
jgi:TRAF3-interacting protein 1